MRAALAIGLLAMAMALTSPTAAVSQGFTRLDCRLLVEELEGRVSVTVVLRADQPTTATYRLRATRMDSSGIGTTEQSGEASLDPMEAVAASRVQFSLNQGGRLDLELHVTESLTGATCEATEEISPL